MSALFNFDDVLAKNATSATKVDMVIGVLKSAERACYEEMEPRLMPPGIAGSRFFDQSVAVQILLKHDKEHKGSLHVLMHENHLSERMLWELLSKALRKVGFKMKSGRLVGLLEHKEGIGPNGEILAGQDTNGTPDVE